MERAATFKEGEIICRQGQNWALGVINWAEGHVMAFAKKYRKKVYFGWRALWGMDSSLFLDVDRLALSPENDIQMAVRSESLDFRRDMS